MLLNEIPCMLKKLKQQQKKSHVVALFHALTTTQKHT